jgi:hypothetical protein
VQPAHASFTATTRISGRSYRRPLPRSASSIEIRPLSRGG